MVRRRPHPVQPRAAVLVPGRGEGAARQLLGVKAEGGPLRRVAALGQRAFHCLAFEMAAEAGQVPHSGRLLPSGAKNKRARLLIGTAPALGRGRATRPHDMWAQLWLTLTSILLGTLMFVP